MIFDWSWVIAIQFIINAVATANLALTLPYPLSVSLSLSHIRSLSLCLCRRLHRTLNYEFLAWPNFRVYMCVCVYEPFSTLLLNLLPIIFTFLFQFVCQHLASLRPSSKRSSSSCSSFFGFAAIIFNVFVDFPLIILCSSCQTKYYLYIHVLAWHSFRQLIEVISNCKNCKANFLDVIE